MLLGWWASDLPLSICKKQAGTFATVIPAHEQNQLNDKLLNHCLSMPKDTAQMRQLIECGASVNARSQIRRTPLMNSAEFGSLSMINELLNLGANVDDVDANGRSALMFAVQRGEKENVKSLLKHGANVNFMCGDGLTALHEAAWSQREDLIHLLVANGANIHAGTEKGWTPMHCASVGGRSSFIGALALMELGADIESPNKNNKQPLTTAVENQEKAFALALIAHGASTHRLHERTHPELLGLPAIHAAARGGFKARLIALLEAKMDPNVRHRGMTAFDEAAQAKQEEALGVLQAWDAKQAIERIMDVQARDSPCQVSP